MADDMNPGIHKRKRSCTNPKPQNGGKNCLGESEEIAECSPREYDQHSQYKTYN